MTIMRHKLLAAAALPLGMEFSAEMVRKDAPDIETLIKEHATATEEAIEEVKGVTGELKEQVAALEQKAARGGGRPDRGGLPSIGSLVIDDENVKAMIGNVVAGRRHSVAMKAVITSATTDADGSAGDMLVPYRDTLVSMPKRRMTIRDLLQVVQVTGNSVEYAKQTGYTNNAATVAEGADKPQSELKIDLVNTPVRTIAHWVLASKQILDDAPQLQGFIDQELLYGLAYVEDNMLLNGAGSGTDLNGIYTQATASTANAAVIATPTKIDVIGMAILQQNLTNLPADGIVLNPGDWTSMQLIKDTAGAYILGNPQDGAQPRLFGLPVVLTPAMTVDKFLVGNFKGSATLYDRWAARVEVSTEDSDNFRKNLVTILAEERLALAVKNTLGFTKGDFSDQITDLTS